MGKDQELLEAARNGNIPIVEKILNQRAKRSGPLASLRRGPGANVQDGSGYSALHHAALNGHKDVVKMLLSHEASTNIVDSKGSSPLHLAAWTGNVDIVRLLLCEGPSVPNVNLTTKDQETALHCAAQYGHTAVVALLLEHSSDATIRNVRQETALDLAAQYGRLETVELLVRTHPELIQPYIRGGIVFPHTPLHLASRNGHKAVVTVLLGAGFDVNCRTSAGTALHEAALCGKLEVVRALLDAGIDLNAKDSLRRTALDLLADFSTRAAKDIAATIRKHEALSSPNAPEDHQNANPPSPSSPYENVRGSQEGGLDSPCSTSPTHWEFYEGPQTSSRSRDEDRRISGTSAMSVGSGAKSLDSSVLSEEADLMSVSSESSTAPSPSPRSRDLGNYLAMAPINSKVSPTPPKKPPRRNLSVSPTHLHHHLSLDADRPTVGAYEYLFLAQSGVRGQDPSSSSECERRQKEWGVRRGKSTDSQYVDMRLRKSMLANYENVIRVANNRGGDSAGEDEEINCIPHGYENMSSIHFAPSSSGTKSHKNTRERRLRRHTTDNFETALQERLNLRGRSDGEENDSYHCDNKKTREGSMTDGDDKIFVSSAYIRLKSSEESLLDDKKDGYHNASWSEDDEGDTIRRPKLKLQGIGGNKKKKNITFPLSPTHYQQPPTPDHPPPSAVQAEKSIHERIRPLSQEWRRRSRDMETETDVVHLGASSGSLSSSVSLSDKSVSTDNVEEFQGDAPFAGLFKGSVSSGSGATDSRVAERPKTLRRLKNVYDGGPDGPREGPEGAEGDRSVSILSPFDEQEEWARISEIMASFGSGLVRESVFVSEMEKEFQARLGLSPCSPQQPASSVGKWLNSLGLGHLEAKFMNQGYDDIDFLRGSIEETDLLEMGILSAAERSSLLAAIALLPQAVPKFGPEPDDLPIPDSVDLWLSALRLDCYRDTFRKSMYLEMERVVRVWEVELTTVLEITKLGHRKRILASVGGGGKYSEPVETTHVEEINADLCQLNSSIHQLREDIQEKIPESGGSSGGSSNTGTLRHSHKKSRPPPPPPAGSKPDKEDLSISIRDPGELLVGMPSTLSTRWRHRPNSLVAGTVTYKASYLGSTIVKELRGTESTKKSIQKLKRTHKEPEKQPEIVLSISSRGVKFLETITGIMICEHEIRNINCACQDADDLTHFAYITKDHQSSDHYCHVFSVQTMDQATEIILTLGQAFEVAYQIALRDQFSSSRGHTRSQSANQIVQKSQNSSSGIPASVTGTTNGNHSRSLSVNEIKLNGSAPQGSKDYVLGTNGRITEVQLLAKRENSLVIEQVSRTNGGAEIKLPTNSGKAPIATTDEM